MIKIGQLVIANKQEINELTLKERKKEATRISARRRNGTSRRAKRRFRNPL